MKILLSAFACSPGKGSEPDIGWNVSCQVASSHQVWVMTDAANAPAIKLGLTGWSHSRPRFVFVRPPAPLHYLRRLPGCFGIYYLLWQMIAFVAAKRLNQTLHFDLVHHVTYGDSWRPVWMGFLGVPFVWSAGARERTPWTFIAKMSLHGKVLELTRNVTLSVFWLLTRGVTASRARLILTSSGEQVWSRDLPVEQLAVGGLDGRDLARLIAIPPRTGKPFRLLSVGRLLAWKGFHLGLEAFAAFHRTFPASEYWIVGAGPERVSLEKSARELDCADAVKFWGHLPRSQVLELLEETDVLIHPSLHEQFGYVLLEAMAAGKPVLCLDLAGPSAIVTSDCGEVLAAQSPDQVIRDLRRQLMRLATQPELRLAMGVSAREHVRRNWTWDAVGPCLIACYERVCGPDRETKESPSARR